VTTQRPGRAAVADLSGDGGVDIDAHDLTQLGQAYCRVAIECSMEPRHRTKPAPFNCSA